MEALLSHWYVALWSYSLGVDSYVCEFIFWNTWQKIFYFIYPCRSECTRSTRKICSILILDKLCKVMLYKNICSGFVIITEKCLLTFILLLLTYTIGFNRHFSVIMTKTNKYFHIALLYTVYLKFKFEPIFLVDRLHPDPIISLIIDFSVNGLCTGC